MAKNIASGIQKLVSEKRTSQEKHLAELGTQWRIIRNRLDVMLLSGNVQRTDESRQLCAALDAMSEAQRKEHIQWNFGPLYLEKAEPLLQQVLLLEREIEVVTSTPDPEKTL